MYIYIYIYIYICVNLRTSVYCTTGVAPVSNIHMKYIYIYICVCVNILISVKCTTGVATFSNIQMNIYTNIYIYICKYTHIYAMYHRRCDVL